MLVKRRTGSLKRYQKIAGGHQIRFHDPVDHGWTLGAVAGNQVVDARRRSHGLHRADRDHIRIIARRSHSGVATGRLIASIISRRHYHHDSIVPGHLDRLTQRIKLVRFIYRAAKRKIDHANVVLRFQRNRLVDGSDHLAVGGAAVRVKYSQVDDICPRGNSLESLAEEPTG